MAVMVLNRPVKGFQPLYSSDGEMTHEQREEELALILGGDKNEESRRRELKAYADRIKILEAELQKARAEAYQAGYAEGQNIAKAEAQKQFSQLTSEFNNNIHSMHSEFTEVVEKLGTPLLKLALGAAEKLIERELSLDDAANEILITQVQRVLNETVSQTRAMVHVNASQLNFITGEDVLKTLSVPQKDNLRFVPNPTIKPGECKLETEDYLVDSTIHAQLENLEKVLRESDAANLK